MFEFLTDIFKNCMNFIALPQQNHSLFLGHCSNCQFFCFIFNSIKWNAHIYFCAKNVPLNPMHSPIHHWADVCVCVIVSFGGRWWWSALIGADDHNNLARSPMLIIPLKGFGKWSDWVGQFKISPSDSSSRESREISHSHEIFLLKILGPVSIYSTPKNFIPEKFWHREPRRLVNFDNISFFDSKKILIENLFQSTKYNNVWAAISDADHSCSNVLCHFVLWVNVEILFW